MKKSNKHYTYYGTCYCDYTLVALEEVGFLLLEKPRCPLANLVGDKISAFMNQPFACAP